jgi:hypothetical protein
VAVAGFAPDAGFALKSAAEEPVKAFLERHGLGTKRFLAVALPGGALDGLFAEATAAWVRRTGWGVVLCPSGAGGVPGGAAVWDGAWGAPEASSLLRRAAAAVAAEDDILIVAAANDTPVVRVYGGGRPPAMWKDVGLGRWLAGGGRGPAEPLLDIHGDYAAAQVEVHEAAVYARKLLADVMARVRQEVLIAKKC